MVHKCLQRRLLARYSAVPLVCVFTACTLALGACSSTPPLDPESDAQSTATQSIPMSGDYPILPNGKLGRPLDWVEPKEPQLPSAATNMNAVGAQYFAQYYLELLAYSINTGNTATLKKVSSPECKPCQSYIENIANQSNIDEWVVGMEFKILRSNATPAASEDDGLYLAELLVIEGGYTDYFEGKIYKQSAEKALLKLGVEENNGAFIVTSLFGEAAQD